MEASLESVIDELMFDTDYDDDGNVVARTAVYTREEAEAMVARRRTILDQGLKMGSYTYYVVAEILKAEGKL